MKKLRVPFPLAIFSASVGLFNFPVRAIGARSRARLKISPPAIGMNT